MMKSKHQETGKLGEALAAQALQHRGYTLIEKNWRHGHGEIDIVARDGACWAFVEVKARHGHKYEYPEDALGKRKAQQLVRLARAYLAEHALDRVSWRIDLVAIELDHANHVQRLTLIPGVTE